MWYFWPIIMGFMLNKLKTIENKEELENTRLYRPFCCIAVRQKTFSRFLCCSVLSFIVLIQLISLWYIIGKRMKGTIDIESNLLLLHFSVIFNLLFNFICQQNRNIAWFQNFHMMQRFLFCWTLDSGDRIVWWLHWFAQDIYVAIPYAWL